jgi:hypothetical protein
MALAWRFFFQELTACYSKTSSGRQFVVTVVDKKGRRSIDMYVGTPGKRVRTLDRLGRVGGQRRHSATKRKLVEPVARKVHSMAIITIIGRVPLCSCAQAGRHSHACSGLVARGDAEAETLC